MKKSHIILIFAQDKRGVIERVAMLFRRKMYNINQISSSNTEKQGIKKVTVRLDEVEDKKIPQILKQIDKIVEVIDVMYIKEDSAIEAEVALIKIENNSDKIIDELQKIQDLNLISLTKDEIIIRIVQEPKKIKKTILLIRNKFVLKELTTSGIAVMKK